MKDQARVVVIGGGIVGCAILYHLAKLGWKDVVLVEKSELTAGATCMAAGLLTQFNSSPTMMRLRKTSSEMYDQLGVYETVGSLRIASSQNQHMTLQRDVSTAKGVGLDVHTISPKEAMEIMPWMSPNDLFSAVYLPGDGHLDPHATTYAVAKAARELGAEIYTGTLVTGIDLSPKGEVTKVKTDQGDILTDHVVNATGLWGAQVSAMVGIQVPSTPVIHQHMALQAVPGFEVPDGEPCFRDTDYLIYGRAEHGGLLLGGWEANPPSCWEDGVPWDHASTELPSDMDRFEEILLNAMKRYPFLENAGIERVVAHPDAFTPDAKPLVGPWPTVKGFWFACGLSMHGFGAAGGLGKALAEWMIEGSSELDLYSYHPWRFGRNHKDPYYAASCARECYKYYYRTSYPSDEDTCMRPRRISPFHHRLQDLQAVFGKKNGWERVNYIDTGHSWRRAGEDQREWGGWKKAPYFDTIAEECKALRERVGMIDMTSFGKIEFKGPGAMQLLQRLAVSNVDKQVDATIYTQLCNHRGGTVADVTITRLDEDHYRLVTGSGFIDNDLGHIKANQREDDLPVEIRDVTEEYAVIGFWGPKSRDTLQKITDDDVSNTTFPYMTAKTITINGVEVKAKRVSYVGELGWELYIVRDKAIIVWDRLWEAGQEFDISVCGYVALESLRLEKGFLYYGDDITTLETPLEAGVGFTVHLQGDDFIGKEALVKMKEEGVGQKLCTLTIGGEDWVQIYGGEAVLHNGKAISRLRAAGYGHHLKKNIGYAYLPPDLAKKGTRFEVEVFEDMIAAEVSPRVLYDAKSEKPKG